jgi:hypothetical protein
MYYVYRFYDHTNGLLYIGRANNPGRRLAEHLAEAPFWNDVCVMTLERYPTLEEAVAAETRQIQDEEPIHNQIHNGKIHARSLDPGADALLPIGRRARRPYRYGADKAERRVRLKAEGVLVDIKPTSLLKST